MVRDNVVLIKGWFDRTLSLFMKDVVNDKQLALLHVDCDLYSSTKTIFDIFEINIRPGTIIVFDELFNYTGSANMRLRYLLSFSTRRRRNMK